MGKNLFKLTDFLRRTHYVDLNVLGGALSEPERLPKLRNKRRMSSGKLAASRCFSIATWDDVVGPLRSL